MDLWPGFILGNSFFCYKLVSVSIGLLIKAARVGPSFYFPLLVPITISNNPRK